jgi:hypothetical protein
MGNLTEYLNEKELMILGKYALIIISNVYPK